MKSLASKEDWFKETFSNQTVQRRENRKCLKSNILEQLCEQPFFDQVREFILILDKIVGSIKSLEGDAVTIADVWPIILEIYKTFSAFVTNEDYLQFSEVIKSSLLTIDKRSHVLHSDIHLVGFYPNPKYRVLFRARIILSKIL